MSQYFLVHEILHQLITNVIQNQNLVPDFLTFCHKIFFICKSKSTQNLQTPAFLKISTNIL